VADSVIPARSHRRLRIGSLWVDALTFGDALVEIERLVDRRQGGSVFTPNVDHVVKASSNDAFARAYDSVSLSLADGMPLVWASPLLGCRLPERVAGSDLLMPLLKMAARRRWRVYLLGGAPGVAEAVARLLTEQMGVTVAGWDDSRIESDGSDPTGRSVARAREAQADLIFVALGPPKQELWIHRSLDAVRPAVALGVGASLDFLVGKYKRAPTWMGRVGLEWLFRLSQEPRRLWRRYLVEGPRFITILLSTWRLPRSERIQSHSSIGSVANPPSEGTQQSDIEARSLNRGHKVTFRDDK
jgi:N-acetylglucosaminyldiphosphoundecaprenol N-acetyl-beta-D-mannosaminyltransferase